MNNENTVEKPEWMTLIYGDNEKTWFWYEDDYYQFSDIVLTEEEATICNFDGKARVVPKDDLFRKAIKAEVDELNSWDALQCIGKTVEIFPGDASAMVLGVDRHNKKVILPVLGSISFREFADKCCIRNAKGRLRPCGVLRHKDPSEASADEIASINSTVDEDQEDVYKKESNNEDHEI